MILDILLGLFVFGAFYKGYTKGIIYSMLSLIAIMVGIIIAMNFSSFAAVWLAKNFNLPSIILPVLSFVLVLIAVIASIKLVAILTEKILKAIMLNFVNKIAGALVWSFIVVLIFSVLVYFVDQAGFLTLAVKQASITYPLVKSLGPEGLSIFQTLTPYLKESFELLNKTVQEAAAH